MKRFFSVAAISFLCLTQKTYADTVKCTKSLSSSMFTDHLLVHVQDDLEQAKVTYSSGYEDMLTCHTEEESGNLVCSNALATFTKLSNGTMSFVETYNFCGMKYSVDYSCVSI